MKRKVLMGFLALTLIATMATGFANAQSINFTLNIPFEFTVGDKVFPAGQYTIKRNPIGSNEVLVIESANKKMSHDFKTRIFLSSDTATENKKLVFTKYGDQRFLSQIWAISPLGRSTRYIISPSKQERELGKQAKENQGGTQPEIVNIVIK